MEVNISRPPEPTTVELRATEAAVITAYTSIAQMVLSFVTALGLAGTLWFNLKAWQQARQANALLLNSEDALLVFAFPDGAIDPEGDFLFDMDIANVGRTAAFVHTLKICGESVIVDAILPGGQSKRFSKFAIVPATAGRKITLEVDVTTPLRGRHEIYKRFIVLPPKGDRKTWFAVNEASIQPILAE